MSIELLSETNTYPAREIYWDQDKGVPLPSKTLFNSAKQSWVSKINIKYQQSDRKTNKNRW